MEIIVVLLRLRVQKMCMNLRGEMKSIPTDTPPSNIHITVIEKLAEAMRISSSEVISVHCSHVRFRCAMQE
jgi:hypothetical protein